MTKLSKRVIIGLCVVLVVSVILLLFKASIGIVRISYNSSELLGVSNSEKIGVSDSIAYKNPDSEYSLADVLYSDDDLDNRQKLYLGNDYNKWYPAIQTAVSHKDKYLQGLNSSGNPEECSVSYEGDIDCESLRSIGKVRIDESLTLVGMCDNTSLIFSYQRMSSVKPKLIFLDASERLFNTKRNVLYSFGDSIPICLKRGCFNVEDTDEYTILYVKG